MAYVIHDVATGDVISAQTTIDQDNQIAANEAAITALDQRVDTLESDVGGITQIETAVTNLQTQKIDKPTTEGTAGQVLTTDGNGHNTWTTVQSGGASVEIDDTLTQQGEAADAKAAGDALATKLAKPATDGTNGQVLTTDGQGGVTWNDALDSTAVESAVGSYINEHPDVIAVADGSITRSKLDASVGDAIDDVSDYTSDTITPIDLTDTTLYLKRQGYIRESGQFGNASGYYHSLITVLFGTPKTIVIQANPNRETHIAFITKAPTTNNEQISFAGDYTSRIMIGAGETQQFTIPDDCLYVFIYRGQNENAIPAAVYFVNNNTLQTKTHSEIENLCGVWEQVASPTTTDIDHYGWSGNTVTDVSWTYTLPVEPGQRVRITNNQSYECYYRLSPETLETFGVGNEIVGATGVKYLNTTVIKNRVDDFYVPEGYHYLIVLHHTDASGNNRFPTSVEVMRFGNSSSGEGGGSDSGSSESSAVDNAIAKDVARIDAIGLTPIVQKDSNGWDVPNTIQQLNVIRKSNRFYFLKWTPLRDIPTREGSTGRDDGGFSPANTAFATGVPYSSNWQDYRYVGITVSVHTFRTAIHNPYSMAYTEHLLYTAPKSAWGRKWNSTMGNATNYFGLVCCGFTAAVTKSEIVWNNGTIPKVQEFTRIDHVDDLDLNVLRIGDVLNDSAHAVAVYGLKRDAAGNVTDIKVSESTSATLGCNIRTLTAAQFRETFGGTRVGGGMIAYRYNNLYKNTDFVPEPTDCAEIDQVLAADSVVTYPNLPTYTNEICTFAGDKATFALGSVGGPIVINYNLDGNSMGSYDRIRLYKSSNNSLVGEWTVAQANATLDGVWDRANSFSTDNYETVDMENHAVVVATKANPLAAGRYYAVLSDGTNDSTNKTEFDVIGNGVTSVEETTDTYKINLSKNIVACYFGTLVSNNGDPYFSGAVKHELTRAEENGKYILINKSDLSSISRSNLYVRLNTHTDFGTSGVVVKVFS